MGAASATHGHTANRSYTTLYTAWGNMRQRCENPKNKRYDRYGARGITVCDSWQTFENFLMDMGERPDGCTLDRIDPDGNYEPGNCRWATAQEQARNRAFCVLSYSDVEAIVASELSQRALAQQYGVSQGHISRVKRGLSPLGAF